HTLLATFFSLIPPPPRSTPFPYTTLFRSGLALVGVDGEQPRWRLLQHQTPFASGRKPCAAEPAQPGMLEDPDDFLGFAFPGEAGDRKSTRLNSSHVAISYAVFCLKKKKET